MSKQVYELSEAGSMMNSINARNTHLMTVAYPLAMKETIDAVLAQARTKSIKYIRTRAKVARWVVARKFPGKLQRKANMKDFYKKSKLAGKSHVLLSPIQAITVLSKRATGKNAASKPPVVDPSKMQKLQGSTKGISLGKAGKYPNAFVSDGRRRESDAKYNDYLQKKYTSTKKLRGKHWQVMERVGKEAYPVNPVTIDIAKFAGKVLQRYTKAVYNQIGPSIFESKQKYIMNQKVKF